MKHQLLYYIIFKSTNCKNYLTAIYDSDRKYSKLTIESEVILVFVTMSGLFCSKILFINKPMTSVWKASTCYPGVRTTCCLSNLWLWWQVWVSVISQLQVQTQSTIMSRYFRALGNIHIDDNLWADAWLVLMSPVPMSQIFTLLSHIFGRSRFTPKTGW